MTYPDFFAGVWSTSPDPVDFRDFQQVDLYANPPLSLYYDPEGRPRPLARRGETPVLWFPSFGKMDDVIGRGGQLRSFEAVFSPLDAAGLPRKLWDRRTGRIDPAVAKSWEPYDIRLKLERNWRRAGAQAARQIARHHGQPGHLLSQRRCRPTGRNPQAIGQRRRNHDRPGGRSCERSELQLLRACAPRDERRVSGKMTNVE